MFSSKFIGLILGLLASTHVGAEAPAIIQAGNLANPDRIEALTGTPLAYQVLASENPTFYSATGLPSGFSINSTTGVISGFSNNPSSSAVIVTASNADGISSSSIPMNVFQREDTLFEEALDVGNNNRTPFTQGQNNNTNLRNFFGLFGGIDGSVNSNRIRTAANLGNGAIITCRTYAMGPGTISFQWRVLFGNPISANFRFFIDDTLSAATSANTYQPVTLNLSPGLHTLEWQFHSTAGGNHGGFLDNVQVTGYPEWAASNNLGALNSDLSLDLEQDSFTLLEEYALGLSPLVRNDTDEKQPTLSFDSVGRAVLEVGINGNVADGITVEIEQNDTLAADRWRFEPLIDISPNNNILRMRESTPGERKFFRLNVTAP